MEVKIFNSLSNKVEVFKPIKEGEVSLYVCGPTVYGDAHLGNLRPVVVFDTLRRLFIYLGYKVTFVSNYTDVDDKIIKRAKELGIDESSLTESTIASYEKLISEIHALAPDFKPRVTEYIESIKKYIQELIDTGYAYEKDGDVFFRVQQIKDYGSLSNMKVEDLIAGARIEKNSKKESPVDFVLWKVTDEGINWEFLGKLGRPGWHTECCVMIDTLLGGKIDIHGGGFDLKFPHHENEIAQAEAHNHNKIANYWMHNGFINFDNEKMSKSLGNVVLAKDAIAKFSGNVIRWILLQTYYRSPLNVSNEIFESASKEIEKISLTFNKLSVSIQLLDGDITVPERYQNEKYLGKFIAELADDLNVPNAISELYQIIKEANIKLRRNDVSVNELEEIYYSISTMLELLGIYFVVQKIDSEDKILYNTYVEAKKNKDFAKSDALREKLIDKKIL